MMSNPSHPFNPPHSPSPDQLDEIRLYLQQWFPDFHYSKKDDYFFAALHAEYPALNLLQELKTFHAWCLDRRVSDSIYRLTFRKWLAKAFSHHRHVSNRSS